ncbi:MAG TPA: condensation domain-containing protein, partial [Pyrinomonadaceae bacterium]|nr:condensation domain-containing protein [Pyrinomonadaceae bacterium]
GGEEVQKSDFELYRKHFSPLCLFVNGLGLTESTVTLQYFANQQTEIKHDTVPVGYAAADNSEVSLFNEAGEQVALYGVGEIIVKSPHIAIGYWRQPELNQTAFLTASADGYWRSYRTGDLGRWLANGTIEYVGRRDNQVKIRGYRVELGEVEAALRTCRGVSECAVVMRRGEKGSGEHLVAYVVMGELQKEGSANEWRQQLEERLPQYMVPSVFMVIDKMPLTASGKLNRRALPEVEASRAELRSEYEGPRTETEKTLVSIWREVLNVERVGIHDNFFKLGGHSLLATLVVSRIRELFRVELPLRNVFEYPTVNALAAKIDTADFTALIAPPIIPMANGGPIPLSFAQQRLWFLDQLESNTSLYNRPAAYLLKGQLNVEALEYSINEVLHRHASLRTYFVTSDDGNPAQQILQPEPFNLPQRDLRQLPEPEREIEVRRVITEEGQKPFQLARAPLLRCLLLRTAEEEHIFILIIHHIITDGWSMSVFLNELAVWYESYLEQRPASLPELTVQYADFAVWQRNWLRGEVFDRLLHYWQQQLKGAPSRLELPADKPRPAIQTYRGAKQFAALSPQLTQSLKELSSHEDATLYMTMLACLNTLLHYYTGQNDIVVGTDVANRNRRETESLIGFFVNELVMRTDLAGNPTFRELVGRVREVALGAYNHQDMPFDRLVDALKIERSPAHHPLFQVCFVLQNTPATSAEVKSLTISTLPVENPIALFDLVLRAGESGQGMQLMLEYNADLFMPTTITRLLGLFETLVGIVVQQPEARLETLVEMLAQADRERLFDKGKALEEIGSRSLKKAKRRAVASQ